MTGECAKEWSFWIPVAEWWYNTNFHTSAQLTPYEVVYNQPPPHHMPYLPRESLNPSVDRSMTKREEMIRLLKFHLQKAQNRMKVQAHKHRTERQLEVGSWVWLKLQPYRQQSSGLTIMTRFQQSFMRHFKLKSKLEQLLTNSSFPLVLRYTQFSMSPS